MTNAFEAFRQHIPSIKDIAKSPAARTAVAIGVMTLGVDCAPQQTPTGAGGEQPSIPAQTLLAEPGSMAAGAELGAKLQLEQDVAAAKAKATQTATAATPTAIFTATPTAEGTVGLTPVAQTPDATLPYKVGLPIVQNQASGGGSTEISTPVAQTPDAKAAIQPFQITESQIPDYLNTLNTNVQALPPLRTGITEDQIPQVKREIQNAVTAAIEALQKGDKKEAAQQVAIINPNLVALGGKTVFIPTETINKIDKDHLYMQAIARGPADPTLMQAYLTNAQMIVGFLK